MIKFDWGSTVRRCRACGDPTSGSDLQTKNTLRSPIHRACAVKRLYMLTNPDLRADGAQQYLVDFDVPLTCELCGEGMWTYEAIEPIADGELSPRCHSACKHPYHRPRTEPED